MKAKMLPEKLDGASKSKQDPSKLSWFVTEYAKTNAREFWAEMFAHVIVGKPVNPAVKKFVMNLVKNI